MLRAAFGQADDVQYEYVMLIIRLIQQLNAAAKSAIVEELGMYEKEIEANERLREVLSSVDL